MPEQTAAMREKKEHSVNLQGYLNLEESVRFLRTGATLKREIEGHEQYMADIYQKLTDADRAFLDSRGMMPA